MFGNEKALHEETTYLKNEQIRQGKVQHNETVPINRLPVELFCIILGQLDRSELFAYESVCERWSYFVKAFVGQQLVISKRTQVRPRHWFYLNKRCPQHSIMARQDLNVELIENSFMFHLKQLKVCDRSDHEDRRSPFVGVQLINRLINLEVLEMTQLDAGECKPITIRLPNLKHLKISELFGSKVILNCPQLVSFKTESMKNRDDVYSLSISHLYLGEYDDHSSLRMLTNLQYLNVESFDFLNSTKEDYARKIFSNFPKLKEISFSFGPSTRSYFEHREACLNCLQEKRALGRDEVALTFWGISIDSEDQLEYLKYDDCRYRTQMLDLLPRLCLQNYSRLCERELRRTKRLGYLGLVDELAKQKLELPRDFYERFDQLREILINYRVPDEHQLLVFIATLKRLNSLRFERKSEDQTLEKAPLGESFFKKLANICSSRPSFALKFGYSYRGLLVDYEFVFEFKNLVYLYTREFHLDVQLIERLFNHFETFELDYRHYSELVEITRSRSGSVLELRFGNDPLKIFSDLDALLFYLDNNDSS